MRLQISYEPDDKKIFSLTLSRNDKKVEGLDVLQKEVIIDCIDRFIAALNVTKKELAKSKNKN